MAELERLVENGPDPDQDGGVVRWRRIDLQAVIADRFEVELHERSVGKLLHRLRFTRLSARPQHPQSDPEAQETFKKTLPRSSPSPSRNELPTPANRSRSGFRTKPASVNRER